MLLDSFLLFRIEGQDRKFSTLAQCGSGAADGYGHPHDTTTQRVDGLTFSLKHGAGSIAAMRFATLSCPVLRRRETRIREVHSNILNVYGGVYTPDMFKTLEEQKKFWADVGDILVNCEKETKGA
ncbi:hypothetical protein EVAR_16515_1 [Eumeta japonica]|uniref:Uncharacterized protein n=1 Tax=Eumeta variegata TaxID=151549 RepID=A0A4C1U2P1_EUMVA|nr:hypothetical protein EVAR_16515_1 [Eumeta japonica]